MAEGTAAAPAAPAGAPGTPAPQQGQAAPAQKPGETPAQAEARRLKLRLGGQEVELDESEVAANYEKGRNASKLLSKVEQRRQEALKAKAEADGLLNRLKSDPRAALRELGVDLRKLSESTILEEIELEKMSPAERRAYEAEQKLKALQDEQEKVKQSEQEKAHAAEVERHKDEFANLFLQTMEAAGLPKQSGRFVAHRMAHLYRQNEEAGLESTPEEMASYVMEGLKGEHRGMLSGLKGQSLVDHLGPEVVKEVLSHHLALARAKRGMGGAPPTPPPPPPPSDAKMDPRKGRWAYIDSLTKP